MTTESDKMGASTTATADIEPMPPNIRSIQPGGGTIQALELAWGRLRRALLKRFRPGYVRQMQEKLKGDPTSCPVEVIDSRDLKYFRNVADCRFEPEDDRFAWRDRLVFARAGLAELVLFTSVFLAIGLALGLGLAGSPWWAAAPLSLVAFTLYFFRDPERSIPDEPGVVVSAADGKVVDISDVEGDEYLGVPAVKIGIFLSVFNVHVNRCPLAGRVAWLRYEPGKFANALFARSAEVNERMVIGLVEPSAPYRRFVVKQIAGAIARRIVCEVRPGQTLETGKRFGMIKFGSRTDILLPKEGLEVLVRVGEKVRGGATRLGRYAEPEG